MCRNEWIFQYCVYVHAKRKFIECLCPFMFHVMHEYNTILVIILKVTNISGAQQEGVEGFFKGIGKGLMGLIIKPNGGVLDSIAMTTDGIKR